MKKIILSILGLCLLFVFAGCGGSGSSSSSHYNNWEEIYKVLTPEYLMAPDEEDGCYYIADNDSFVIPEKYGLFIAKDKEDYLWFISIVSEEDYKNAGIKSEIRDKGDSPKIENISDIEGFATYKVRIRNKSCVVNLANSGQNENNWTPQDMFIYDPNKIESGSVYIPEDNSILVPVPKFNGLYIANGPDKYKWVVIMKYDDPAMTVEKEIVCEGDSFKIPAPEKQAYYRVKINNKSNIVYAVKTILPEKRQKINHIPLMDVKSAAYVFDTDKLPCCFAFVIRGKGIGKKKFETETDLTYVEIPRNSVAEKNMYTMYQKIGDFEKRYTVCLLPLPAIPLD